MIRNYLVNKAVRLRMQQNCVAIWEIADAIGVSEMTINRWLRKELDEPHRNLIEDAIERILAERGGRNE